MSDLIERLRAVDHGSVEDCFLQSPLFGEAADRITALEKENAELRKALEFYADSKNWDDGHFKMDEPNAIVLVTSTIDQDQGDLARSTMEDIHREQREVPRLRPARPRKPSEAEGRTE